MAKYHCVLGSSLWQFYKKYNKRFIQIPTWQRGQAWSQSLIEGWWLSIDEAKNNEAFIPGVFSLCRLISENLANLYLNDGFNRTLATHQYIEHKKQCGWEDDMIEDRLENCIIATSEVFCEDPMDALKECEKLNQGVVSTTYEKSNAFLAVKLPDYRLSWEDTLHEIDRIIDNVFALVGITNLSRIGQGKNRQSIHRQLRDNRSLYYRWLINDDNLSSYYCGDKQVTFVNDNKNNKHKLFEFDFANQMINKGPSCIKNTLRQFQSFLEREIQTLNNLRIKDSSVPLTTFVKDILHLSIYRKNNPQITNKKYENFILDLLKYTDNGTSPVVIPGDEDRKNGIKQAKMGLGNLDWVNSTSNILHNDSMINILKRVKSKKKLLPGMDNSHIKNFKEFGNGDTFPEPASRNRARGACDVDINNIESGILKA